MDFGDLVRPTTDHIKDINACYQNINNTSNPSIIMYYWREIGLYQFEFPDAKRKIKTS